jgi:hypothetical protein
MDSEGHPQSQYASERVGQGLFYISRKNKFGLKREGVEKALAASGRPDWGYYGRTYTYN